MLQQRNDAVLVGTDNLFAAYEKLFSNNLSRLRIGDLIDSNRRIDDGVGPIDCVFRVAASSAAYFRARSASAALASECTLMAAASALASVSFVFARTLLMSKSRPSLL